MDKISNTFPIATNKYDYLKEFTNRNRLKELREKAGYTQSVVAEKISCVLKTYQNYEQGRTIPELPYIEGLANLYNVSIDYLLGRSDCKSVDNEYIKQVTSLSDVAIDRLKEWKKYDDDIEKGGAVKDDSGRILFYRFPQENYYKPSDTLNELLNATYSDFLLRSIKDFLHTHYKYPVYYHNNKLEVPKSEMDYIDSNTPILHLASDPSRPNDYYDINLDSGFLEAAALHEVVRCLDWIKDELYGYEH